MSFHVNKRRGGWRLLSSAWTDGKVKYSHVPNDQLLQYNLSPDMPIEDARARVKQLNAQNKLDKEAAQSKAGALSTQKRGQKLNSAHLPTRFVTQFVETYLRAEYDLGPNGPYKYKKATSSWGLVTKLIIAVNLPQQHWHKHRRRFYGELQKRKVSPSYTGKVLRILNLWGTFIAEKTNTSFIPIPPPRGYDREMIADAHFDSDKASKISEPITPELLEAARSRLSEPQYRWLYLSVWLGLRPSEVDNLHTAKITREQGVSVLWLVQTKIGSLKREKRVKPIPLVYKEQKACLKMLAQEIKKPLTKTVKKHVLAGANLYGGRKGFVDLMLGRGQSIEDISTWLGHSRIERTWASYKQKQKVSFRKAG